MGFDQFLQARELAERLRENRKLSIAARETLLISRAPQAWRELQEAVRKIAEGKFYKGERFVWRAATGYPASLVLKNVAASFVDREWDSRTFTVLLGGIPGIHALWATTSPDPEFIDVCYKGPDRWIMGALTEELKTTGENSAAEQICRALVTYFDDFQQTQGRLVS